jgi:osmotically-inducible protein OsmY
MIDSILGAEPRAQKALSSSPVPALRDLTVERNERTLQIRGQVASYYHKQLAQEVVRAVAGDLNVVNSVEVRYGAEID